MAHKKVPAIAGTKACVPGKELSRAALAIAILIVRLVLVLTLIAFLGLTVLATLWGLARVLLSGLVALLTLARLAALLVLPILPSLTTLLVLLVSVVHKRIYSPRRTRSSAPSNFSSNR
jgi:hypothetical protein